MTKQTEMKKTEPIWETMAMQKTEMVIGFQ